MLEAGRSARLANDNKTSIQGTAEKQVRLCFINKRIAQDLMSQKCGREKMAKRLLKCNAEQI